VVAGLCERGAELGQVLGPEAGQELLHGGEAVGVDHEQVAGARAALVDQAGLAPPGLGVTIGRSFYPLESL
jgi:hypothetical protein